MSSSYKETKPDETICYKCSTGCMSCCSSCFGALSRHKMRSFIFPMTIIATIGFLVLQIYVYVKSDGDKFFAIFFGNFIYIIGAIIDSVAYVELPQNGDRQVLPFRMIKRFIGFFGSNMEDHESLISYYLVVNLLIHRSIMSLVGYILYVNDIPISEWWIALGLFGFLTLILISILYFFIGIIKLIKWCCVECCIKPYYGCRNMDNSMNDSVAEGKGVTNV